MSAPSVAAVIPVHNRSELLQRLLETAGAQTVPFTEIVAIDNASTDHSVEIARGFGCRVIAVGSNSGFAHAVNCGWKEATAEWIAILNTDVELDAHWLERLLGAAVNSSFATGTIFSATDHRIIDATYDLVSRAACAWRAGFGETRASVLPQSLGIAIPPATACIFRRDALERLGGFDESFVSYLEDVDLGLRCVREGMQGVYVPDAIAYHHGSATFGRWDARTVRLISRNQLLLVAHHYDSALLRSCFWAILAGQLLWGMVALRHGRLLPWLAGKIDGLREFRLDGRPSPRLREFLIASENEIRRRAKDSYWRWYFRLTGSH
ncbi:MAG TPA: glycosyltransferase family 2 protein [Bryobacteraceae bacterium]|nr:glycosyltransferase family 2 protein [Bryobacteraceae bacterium]